MSSGGFFYPSSWKGVWGDLEGGVSSPPLFYKSDRWLLFFILLLSLPLARDGFSTRVLLGYLPLGCCWVSELRDERNAPGAPQGLKGASLRSSGSWPASRLLALL